MNDIELREKERLDDLNHLGRKVIQRTDAFCFGMDAVLLAHFPKYGRKCRVLDLGTGTGVIPLLMVEEAESVEAVELDPEMAERAARSVAYNGLEDKIHVRQGDYRNISELYPNESFDVVLANPPYYPLKSGLSAAVPERARARHEYTASLSDVVRAARYALKYHGRFVMVHIPERLDEIFIALGENQMAAKRAMLVEPRQGKPANLAIVEAMVGGRPGNIRWLPTLRVYDADGNYTPEALRYYGKETCNDEPAGK